MEIWKDIQGFEGIYQISSLGRVKSLSRLVVRSKYGNFICKDRIMATKNLRGYRFINLTNKNSEVTYTSIHRLIAIHFISNPENKPDVNHINGIRNDNRIENLEWCTPSENAFHAYRTKLRIPMFGAKNPQTKLTKETVLQIVEKGLYASSYKVGKDFEVDHKTIENILSGHTWSHVTGIKNKAA